MHHLLEKYKTWVACNDSKNCNTLIRSEIILRVLDIYRVLTLTYHELERHRNLSFNQLTSFATELEDLTNLQIL